VNAREIARMLTGKDSVDVHSLTDEQFRLYKALLKKHIDSGEPLSPDDQNAWCLVLDRERPVPRPKRLLELVPLWQWTGQEVELNKRLYESIWWSKRPLKEKAERFLDFPKDILIDYGKPGHFRRWWPRTFNAYHWTKNRLVLAWILWMLATPVAVLATDFNNTACIVYGISLLLNLWLMAKYAPLYASVGFVPYWFLWAAVSAFVIDPWIGSDRLTKSSPYLLLSVVAWTLYPLLKGVWHTVRWEGERRRGEDLHPTIKHPWLVLGLCGAAAVGNYYLLKDKRQP